jgi:hypothetical protein
MAPILVLLLILYLNQWGNNPIPFLPYLAITGILILVTLLFYKLTIRIEGRKIEAIYGIGLIKFTIRIDVLNSVSMIRTPWWYGWGIRFTPKGRLYNIHGSQAVRIEYRREGKSRKIMLGTPEPEKLKDIIEKHFGVSENN